MCVCGCVCVCVCVCACVCVVSVIVKRPVLPLCVADGRSRNPLYYYYYKCFLWAEYHTDFRMPHSFHLVSSQALPFSDKKKNIKKKRERKNNKLHHCQWCVQYTLGRMQPMSLTSPTSQRPTRSPALHPVPTPLTPPCYFCRRDWRVALPLLSLRSVYWCCCQCPCRCWLLEVWVIHFECQGEGRVDNYKIQDNFIDPLRKLHGLP